MLVNYHKNFKPSTLDDINSLLYSLMYLADFDLPWLNINSSSSDKNEEIMKIKIKRILRDYIEKISNIFL